MPRVKSDQTVTSPDPQADDDTSSEARLTRAQRIVLVVTALAVAVTRLVALSHSFWDWDEALFCMALRSYDVAAHHPHPPGFPLYVLAGKFFHFFTTSEFRALRAFNTVVSALLFPAMFWMARRFRFDFATSFAAALIFVFLPNVWYYGGTALSDVSAALAIIAAVAMLLGSRDSRRKYLLGCILVGVAVAFRPQNALMALFPWMFAAWPRLRDRKVELIAGALLSLLVAGAAYGGAAKATGFADYLDATRAHSHFVARNDTYQNAARKPSRDLLYTFAFDQVHAHPASIALAIICALAVLDAALRRDRRVLFAALTFTPFYVFAVFMLNPLGVARLSLGYMPLLAILLAAGVAAVARLMTLGRGRWAAIATVIFAGAIAAWWIQFTLPALQQARTTDSPPVRVMQWVEHHLPAKGSIIYVHDALAPYAEVMLPQYDVRRVSGDMVRLPERGPNAWYLRDRPAWPSDAITFVRDRGRLWDIVAQRYFEASIRPASEVFDVRDPGWYSEEYMGESFWQWMGSRSRTWLSPAHGPMVLEVGYHAPVELEPRRPNVRVLLNGKLLDVIAASDETVERRYVVDALDRWNELTLEVDETANPAQLHRGGDTRNLGLCVYRLTWKPPST